MNNKYWLSEQVEPPSIPKSLTIFHFFHDSIHASSSPIFPRSLPQVHFWLFFPLKTYLIYPHHISHSCPSLSISAGFHLNSNIHQLLLDSSEVLTALSTSWSLLLLSLRLSHSSWSRMMWALVPWAPWIWIRVQARGCSWSGKSPVSLSLCLLIWIIGLKYSCKELACHTEHANTEPAPQ